MKTKIPFFAVRRQLKNGKYICAHIVNSESLADSLADKYAHNCINTTIELCYTPAQAEKAKTELEAFNDYLTD